MLFGHEDKIELFKRLVLEDKLSQSYLFFGQSGTGKFTFAKALAFFLEYGEFALLERPLVDTWIIALKEENDSIGIDEIRQLKKFLYITPSQSSKRLVIIDGCEDLSIAAQPSLLKIVEEPPPHSMIIFIACNPQSLIPALLSRLVQIYFKNFSKTTIEELLVKNCALEQSKAKELAKKSFGSIGRAITIAQTKQSVKNNQDLISEVEDIVIKLYLENPVKNSQKISFLLEKEQALKHFNLNQKLQAKAIEYFLGDTKV